ncbi:MAG: endolytic transglycosylase MltG [Nevskia sp.]|nr:endolytic transglycosylase MltG [Nevskia sp.]
MKIREFKALRPAWLLAAAVLGLGLGLALDAWLQLTTPLRLAQGDTVELEAGQRLSSLLRQLGERGVFTSARQPGYLLAYARLHGEAAALKAGEYAVEPGLTPLGLLHTLTSGKTVLHELRLVEGWRFAQAWRAIQADPNVAHTLTTADNAAIVQSAGRPGSDPEGMFFPDTYRFPKHTSDMVLLRQARAEMDRVLAAEWAGRAPGLPYAGPAQALIMASLVEKESALPAERPIIAGVFLRRLQLGMRLQTDPSVIYGLGEAYDGSLHSDDLRLDTPYNTYTRAGLPPTPICLPGREAIHAALHPDAGKSLYFVAKGDGSHQFSDTLDAHNAAVMQYQIKPHQHRD